MLVASAGPVEDSTLVDDETRRDATVAIQAAYTAAIELVAPRVLARINALTAAAGSGDNDQLITDSEWSQIAQTHVEDSLGDSLLDGVIAGAAQFAQLANPATLVRAFLQAASGFVRFASQLRSNLDTWITNQVGQGITGDWGIGRVIEELGRRSPLSPDKANVVIDSELQAANNAGLFSALNEAGVAALRWVTMRDERVRPTHEHADRDTIPLGEKFTVGGYPARFPGDPDLPFALRVNCRCSLAYVDGTEVRRVIGSTKAELRAKAASLSISGRAKMNKGQLQHAVLAELCLQGMAGGPDCPQVFDHMNRTALLTVARGEGITGRYRMSREQLVYELRQSVGGGDIAQTAKGYATKAEFSKSRKLATYKRGRATVGEFSTGTTPPPEARRRSRQAVFDEFGGEVNGSVPCVHCGLRLSADPTSGLALLVPEPIIPWSEGGTLALSNLVPSCPSCFRALGGRGLTAAAWQPGVIERATPDQFAVADFTHDGAVKAWQSRDRGKADQLDLQTESGDVEDMFTLHGDLYDAEVVGVERGWKNTNVLTVLHDKDGNDVGTSERVIRPGPDGTTEVYHNTLVIKDKYQGHGIGAEYLRDSVEMYAEHGVDRVAVSAVSTEGTTNGGYTWAKLGFRLNPAKNGAENMAQTMLQSSAAEDASFADLAEQVRDGEADIPEILAHPKGKDFLLGKYGPIAWNGYLPVHEPALAAAAVVDTSSVDYDDWEAVEQGQDPFDDTAEYTLRSGERVELTHDGAIKAWQTRDHGNDRGQQGAGLPDVPFADVHIAYKPRHPDGHADPGEVVWADVPFEEDKSKSKDRPVLIIGRTADGKNLVALQMTSKPGPGRKNLGDGAWDTDRRDSYLKFDRFIQIDEHNYRKEGAYMKKPQFQEIVDELTKRQHAPDVNLALAQFTHDGAIKAWQSRDHGDGGDEGTTLAEHFDTREEAVGEFNTELAHLGSEPVSGDDRAEFEQAVDALDQETGYSRLADSMYQYEGDGHIAVNRRLNGQPVKAGEPGFVDVAASDQITANLDTLLASPAAIPAPNGMVRGKNSRYSRLAEMDYKVGDTYTDKSFGSFTTDPNTAYLFTDTRNAAQMSPWSSATRAVVISLTDANGVKSIPGNAFEHEMILPRNLTYEVTDIHDFIGPGVQYRILSVKAKP